MAKYLLDTDICIFFLKGKFELVQKIDAIGFGMAHVFPKVAQGKPFDACFTIEENEFNGQKNIQLNLKDIK